MKLLRALALEALLLTLAGCGSAGSAADGGSTCSAFTRSESAVCASCVESNCSNQVSAASSPCADFVGCACSNGGSVTGCKSKLSESSCQSASQAIAKCVQDSCAGQCLDGGEGVDSSVRTESDSGPSSGGQEASAGRGDSGATGGCPDPGQTACGTRCTNLQTDIDNCGTCGAACTTGACFDGRCVCVANQTECIGVCTDTQVDNGNCGGCGTACPAGQACTGGVCACAMGQTDCNGTCTDMQTDNRNCGACGTACGTGQSCTGGTCTCPSGQTLCGNSCTNEQTDNDNCGICGNFCELGQLCSAGTCATTCNSPLTLCGTACANTSSDPANCGMCGTVCGPYENAAPTCGPGGCGYACTAGYLDCSSTPGCETNGLTDGNNCGACGNVCPGGSLCTGGSCGLTLSGGTTTIDTTATTALGTAGSATITVGDSSGFVSHGLVFVHQTQAATGAVGFYEFARVASVSAGRLTLAAPLAHTYVTDATHAAQVVLVPEYGAVTVGAGATLTAPPWNGTTGGILVFDAQKTVTVAGSIVMDGRGFRGTSHPGCGTHCVGGISGESQLALGAEGPGTVGSPANGAGGAGGSQGQDCGEGGGGAYGTVGSPGGVRTLCDYCGPDGCSTSTPDGSGGDAVGGANLASVVLFGGAGGEGGLDEDGGQAGVGGSGGGLIFIRANTINVSATGLVSSAGTEGGNGTNAVCGSGCGMGGAGGGAGGAIRLVAPAGASVGASQLVVSGGGGGVCTCSGGGIGGTGGVGRIGVLASGGVSGTTSPPFDPE
jgi:hypothetical protein